MGGEVGRAFVWDRQSMSVSVQAYYHVVHSDLRAEWQTRTMMGFLF
ncbi:MAG: hypothetical protein U0231_18695 [Nitrospiraceae bacterium]